MTVTLWYDGACPLCSREIALLRRLDTRRQVHFIDLADPSAACPLEPAAMLARFHAREDTGPLLSGAAAFAAVWRALPLLRPLGVAAQWPPLLRLLERAYVAFLGVRPRLQRWLTPPAAPSAGR
ncbi:thiol-disulfide oxidoreductase DCC family protein [Sandaracinobacteroides saxicola]|uniref:DUF393 domain-containing protein n=1 Tax=Sandaracinobacteroides saxicola TaxID=2759707 RepID=A0A7G5IGW7_9SPHN|nr:DUF393 domain-containing protein [Sandaracinobacteroides saxicola]QMW22609.1 DUF393 domain-containing protein [Sandaracinobacteroides saxicola]